MATPNTARADPRELPTLARLKLDRLRELRAVIDSLHRERESHDPYLPWLAPREAAENH
jgi:hypothetical protein